MLLDLTLNKQLIPKGYFHNHQLNGTQVVHRPKTAEEVDLCQYKGTVRGKPQSWVALSTCDGLSGVIFDGKEMHYVEKGSKSEGLDGTHFWYKHSDLVNNGKMCGYHDNVMQTEKQRHEDNRIHRYKRAANQPDVIRGPYNSNKESKYVELVIVIDNREYKELGENKPKVLNHAKTIANIINGLYSPLNIFIALVGVVIWSENDEISFSPNGDTTLTNFLHYRREQLIKTHPNDNAQLLTKFNFENGVVGKALKGPICTYEFSGGVNTDHSPVVGLVATTVAHEMGHNFGMEHDTNECKCPEDRCIMAPSSSTIAPVHWSSCSLNYLLLAFTHGMDYCLKNKPTSLFDGPVCGNGFVEPGEDCDCGLPESCQNTCCNATSCRLHDNATCATGECCDFTTCRAKEAGTLCRPADYECDLPEYCTGDSEYCPEDVYKLDTEECDGGKSYCYHGFCRTRTDQCKLLWGETGKSSDDQCYMMNTKGTRHGNCGYDKLTQSYYKCDNESVLCGMLHCKHLNERLEFGMESVAILSHSFINKKGSIIPCRTALVDLGINQIDPGLTPDGALCGEGKICVKQKCTAVASLRRSIPSCPQDCNGNGWCNSMGHCHCKDGFAPPYCDYPGPGGSIDSGPATDPNARKGIVTALFVIFLGIIPVVAIIFLLSYYARHNVKLGWKPNMPAMSKSPNKTRGQNFGSDIHKKTEDNHSLLHEDSPPPTGLQNSFFGHFEGFIIAPLKNETEPVRVAPPPPLPAGNATVSAVPPTKSIEAATAKPPSANKTNVNSISKGLFKNPVQKHFSFSQDVNTSTSNPAVTNILTPSIPGCSSTRPIISNPVLKNSTCTAKELNSPLKSTPMVPVRPAPEIAKNERPLSIPPVNATLVIRDENSKNDNPPHMNTLNRIASFLKPSDKKPATQKVIKTLGKDTLRNIEISNPIPQAIPSVNNKPDKAVVMRAQSMRAGKAAPKPNIQTFGSMRQPAGFKRPLSIPFGARPKSPPPPRPVESSENDAKAKNDTNQYDDCLNKNVNPGSCGSSDNIYAVIEESPKTPFSPADESCKTGSSESMGLLGEIVSEIQNRTSDSIYSTSTLARKNKEEDALHKADQNALVSKSDPSERYVNTSVLQQGSEYSDMSGNVKSSTSSTYGGYILPSAVKGPTASREKKEENLVPSLATFKSDSVKPLISTLSESSEVNPKTKTSNINKVDTSPNRVSKARTSPSPNSNKTTSKPTMNKQAVTNINSKRPLPARPTSGSKLNRSTTNSPDLVTSCNTNTPKQPDVLGNSTALKKPAVASVKPVTNNVSKVTLKPTGKYNGGVLPEKKTGLNKVNASNSEVVGKTTAETQEPSKSYVSSLAQKYDNKNKSSDIKIKTKT
nr:unnamed protein product [Callosobruchus analis]